MSDVCVTECTCNSNAKEIIASNYGMLKDLENMLNSIANEVKYSDCTEMEKLLANDMISALEEHNRLICRCCDHARYIKNALGI